MAHRRGAGREQGEIRAALLLQPQLVLFDGLADLVVRNGAGLRRGRARLLETGDLCVAEFLMSRGRWCSDRDSR